MQDSQGVRPSQHGFMKSRSCLTILFSFYEKVIELVDDEKSIDVLYLNLSKTSDTVSCNVLEKLGCHGFYRYTIHWGKKKNTGWLGLKGDCN